jgi:uncharacterized protein YkwD
VRAIATLPIALGACWIALTAAASPYHSLESGVLARINFARQHPREYAEQLREYRGYIRGGILFMPGDGNGIYTREGRVAVDEAIDFLENQAPLPPLGEGQILALAARDHADEQGRFGDEGHLSPDGASPGERF